MREDGNRQEHREDQPRGWTARFDRWIRNTPVVLILALLAFLISTTITIAGPVASAIDRYQTQRNWRKAEYKELVALKAGFTVQRFEQVLGAPSFRRPSTNGRWIESSFEGRDYWVQTISARSTGAVALYAATSCSQDFNPTFEFTDGTRVKLHDDTLASVEARQSAARFARADYFAPAATANASFIDYGYGGNPSNYKAFAWGFNDACVNLQGWWDYLSDLSWPFGMDGEYRGPANGGGPEVQTFRRRIPVNTYAETSPSAGFEFFTRRLPFAPFQVGVDRILIRTVIQPSYGQEPESVEPPAPPPPPPVRRAHGSAALQRAWRCFHRSAGRSSYDFQTWVFDKRNYMVDPGQRPPAPIFKAPGGFLVVRTFVGRIRLRDVRAFLGFAQSAQGAKALSAAVAATGVARQRVSRKGAVAIQWHRATLVRDRPAITRCV